jgi:hypothetical protein
VGKLKVHQKSGDVVKIRPIAVFGNMLPYVYLERKEWNKAYNTWAYRPMKTNLDGVITHSRLALQNDEIIEIPLREQKQAKLKELACLL